MKWIYLLMLLIIVSFYSDHANSGETIIQLHTVSQHYGENKGYGEGNLFEDWNEANLGVGIRDYSADGYLTYGIYSNSIRKASAYIGYGWEMDVGDFKVGVVAGLITGYNLAEVLPYIVPVIRYDAVSIVVAPYPEPVVHIIVDILEW